MTRGIFLIDDDPRPAMQAEFESTEAARKAGSRPIEAIALANAAEAAIDLGRWSEADGRWPPCARWRLSGCLAGGVDAERRDPGGLPRGLREADAHLEETASDGTTTHLAARTWYLRTRSMVELLRGDLDRAFDARYGGASTPIPRA